MSASAGASQRATFEELARLRCELAALADADADAGRSLRDILAASSELHSAVSRLAPAVRELEIQADAGIDVAVHGSVEGFDPLEFDRYTSIHETCRSLSEQASDLQALEVQIERSRNTLASGLDRRAARLRRLYDGVARLGCRSLAELGEAVQAHLKAFAGARECSADLVLDGTELAVEQASLPGLGALLCMLVECPLIQASASGDAGGEAVSIEVGLSCGPQGLSLAMTASGPGVDLAAWRSVLQGGHADEALHRALAGTMRWGRLIGAWIALPSTDGAVRAGMPHTESEQSVLFVACGGTLLGLPNRELDRVVRLEDLGREKDGTLLVDGRRVPTLDLATVVHGAAAGTDCEARRYAALLGRAERRCALLFDRVHGTGRARLIPLADPLPRMSLSRAAALLDDGTAVMVLDPKAMLDTGSPEREAPVAPRSARAPQVLVVDDSVTIRKVAQRMLVRNKLSVQLARDGREALEKLAGEPADLILLDIEMPRMNGFQLAEALRGDAQLAEIPIVMISSRTGDKHRQRAAELGVRAFLGKPFKEPELMSAITEILQWQP
jgi:chemosensory pili system protein ChpA (sensor histidine kinase/response regulator)